jgi:hypothetical protein
LPEATAEELQALGMLHYQSLHRQFARDARPGSPAIDPRDLEDAEERLAERNRKLEEVFPEVCRKIRELLTPEQLAQWDAMQGVRLESWELDEIRGGLGGGKLAGQP